MSSKVKTGKMIIKPGAVSYNVLKWMQQHEGQLKKTTAHRIAEAVAALDGVENGVITIEQQFAKMIKANVVYRERYPKRAYSDYRINYWHESIPEDILADAPASVKRAMVKTIDNMSEEQYMDSEGCVVTPNAVEKTEDPFDEDGTEEGTFENPIKDEVSPWEERYEEDGTKTYTNIDINDEGSGQVNVVHVPEQKTQEVSVPVEVKKDGKTTNVTINLTINI
jgi:hypothetical protein